jgi:hypothetical protein
MSEELIWLAIAYPFGYLASVAATFRWFAIMNYNKNGVYGLDKKDGDRGLAFGASIFCWPLLLVVAVIANIYYQIEASGSYEKSILLPRAPKFIRNQIEAKAHEERCRALELEP